MAPKTRDYFAEMYVAGVLADAGWNVYFPRRDQGFDFVIAKPVGAEIVIRPVQVKGKYPSVRKGDKATYGYSGRLTQLHPEMVLALPFFPTEHAAAPLFTVFLPRGQIRARQNDPELFFTWPARFEGGRPVARRDYAKFVDAAGIALIESTSWPNEAPSAPTASAAEPLVAADTGPEAQRK